MMMKIKYIYLLLLFFNVPALGQNYDFKQFREETVDFISIPAKWNIGEYALLAGFSAATYGIMQIDKDVKNLAMMNQGYGETIPLRFGTLYGEPVTTMLAGIAFIAHAQSYENHKNQRIGFEILQAFTYTASITTLIKVTFGRARPYLDLGSDHFAPFSFGFPEKFSFFSGHTSLAFSLSTILAKNQEKDIYKVLIYIPAVVTGFSRIYHNKHWLSDVFLGGVAGYFIASWVHHQHDHYEEGIPEHTPVLTMSIGF